MQDRPTGTAPEPESLHRLSSEDAARVLSPRAGWSRPALSPEQQDQLLSRIRPALLQGGELHFRRFVSRIFAEAVESSIAFGEVTPRKILDREVSNARERLMPAGLDPALPPAVREALEALRPESLSSPAQAAVASSVEVALSPTLLDLVEAVLHEEIPPEVRANGSFGAWLRSLDPERRRELQRQALERVEVEVKRGPSNTIHRRMVRGLAALVHDVTGVVPARTYRAHVRSDQKCPVGEVYWFLDLAKELARFVNDALPEGQRRPGVAALTGIVAEELEALRESEARSTCRLRADTPPG